MAAERRRRGTKEGGGGAVGWREAVEAEAAAESLERMAEGSAEENSCRGEVKEVKSQRSGS